MTHKVLILGATGMLGHKLLDHLSRQTNISVQASCRDLPTGNPAFLDRFREHLITKVYPTDADSLRRTFEASRPQTVINCIGIIKQLKESKDPIPSIEINALLPQRLMVMCREYGARLIHMSTDCIFDGKRGSYSEADPFSATDLYGMTKYLGEIHDTPGLTLRTSIIGHELARKLSLVDWFLAQNGEVRGFTNAIYSGLPTIEMASLIHRIILHHPELTGLYHVSSQPISKYDLLKMIGETYGLTVQVRPDPSFCCDRSLVSTRFSQMTGYHAPPWTELVRHMHQDRLASDYYGQTSHS